MSPPDKRTYTSPARRQQADETRSRIAASAHELLLAEGYAAMTIEAVARRAGVSAPSVYAIFGSKPGLVGAVIERAAFGAGYQQLVDASYQSGDPVQRLRIAAAIACQIYTEEHGVIELIGGAGMVSPELAAMLKAKESQRRQSQSHLAPLLQEAGLLKPSLDTEDASDILWTLTGRDLYRMLVQDRGWPAEKYQRWLADTLVGALVG